MVTVEATILGIVMLLSWHSLWDQKWAPNKVGQLEFFSEFFLKKIFCNERCMKPAQEWEEEEKVVTHE